MITGVAFCPQAPALVPAVGAGLDAELGPVRDACRVAVRRVAPPGTRVVVVGGADVAEQYGPTSRGSFAGFGVDLVVPLGSDAAGPVDLPPSLAVGAWLVRDALGTDTGAGGLATVDASENLPLDADVATALVVVGDGSARRSEKAPGHLDPRAAAFDAALAAALRSGEGDRLHLANEDTADDLMVVGAAVWELVAGETEAWSPWDAVLHYEGAPFGVGYHVASWVHPVPHDRRLRVRAEQQRGEAEIMADLRADRATVRIDG